MPLLRYSQEPGDLQKKAKNGALVLVLPGS
jgi:hypothetical protein